MLDTPTKPPNAGKGRKKGVPNKATADVRAAVALLAQNLVGDLENWIRRGAKKNPLGAAKIAGDIFEYHLPKLTRTELTGLNGGPVQTVAIVTDDPIEAGRQYQRMVNGG